MHQRNETKLRENKNNQNYEIRDKNIEINANEKNRDVRTNSNARENSSETKMRSGNMKQISKKEFEFEDDITVTSEEVLWATKMLQAQSHIETRLGKRYY